MEDYPTMYTSILVKREDLLHAAFNQKDNKDNRPTIYTSLHLLLSTASLSFLPSAYASVGGTALPICLYLCWILPANW